MALSRELAKNGYIVGATGRRGQLLRSLADEFPDRIKPFCLDACSPSNTTDLAEMIDILGGLDLFIFCAGTGHINDNLEFDKERETIDLNVFAFTAMAGYIYNYFELKKSGHLVCISSIASKRGSRNAPAYNASKAYQANYMEGLAVKSHQSGMDIYTTDVQPGFVDTDMAKGASLFWVASPEKAAKQIIRAVNRKKRKVYVTRRWFVFAWLLRVLPDFLYLRIKG